MDLAQIGQLLFGAATFVAALGAFAVAWRNRFRADRAAKAAEAAAGLAVANKATLIEIKGQIYELGKAVDGRLSKLLEQTEARGKAEGRALHAEGVVQGEQAERDRTTNGDVK
jgi:hypothetical protein